MASFSYQQQHHPNIHVDSIFMAKNNDIVSGLLVDHHIHQGSNNNSNTSNCFPQFYNNHPIVSNDHHGNIIPVDNICSVNYNISKTSCDFSASDHDRDNEPYYYSSSVVKKHSTESSTIVDKLESSGDDEQVTQKLAKIISSPEPKKRKSTRNSALTKEKSSRGNKKQNNNMSEKEEIVKKVKVNSKNDETKKGQEEPPTGYIHVRARRGQATDSHSLAERVRRERISERMKMLQRLVPGCEKVTGKALMLDEIINYVQSLQNQVEFLSMKLASLNPMFYDFGMDIDTFGVRPEGINTLASQIPSMPQNNQDNNNNNHNNYYYYYQAIMDNSPALMLQQGQRQNTNSHDNVSLLWNMEDQRQSFLNPSGFNNFN